MDDFIRAFTDLWREDRDTEWALLDGSPTSAVQFDGLTSAVDREFTACDCFAHEPRNEFEISEVQLRLELQDLLARHSG